LIEHGQRPLSKIDEKYGKLNAIFLAPTISALLLKELEAVVLPCRRKL